MGVIPFRYFKLAGHLRDLAVDFIQQKEDFKASASAFAEKWCGKMSAFGWSHHTYLTGLIIPVDHPIPEGWEQDRKTSVRNDMCAIKPSTKNRKLYNQIRKEMRAITDPEPTELTKAFEKAIGVDVTHHLLRGSDGNQYFGKLFCEDLMGEYYVMVTDPSVHGFAFKSEVPEKWKISKKLMAEIREGDYSSLIEDHNKHEEKRARRRANKNKQNRRCRGSLF